jgi:uncharacterized SAM-binding protein YcdF (DUF218 family)
MSQRRVGPSPFPIRVRRFVASVPDAGLRALALATLLGVALDLARPGSALHPHFMGSTGSPPLDAAIAAGFAVLVLLPGPLLLRAPRSSRAASLAFGAAVTGLATRSLGRQALALIDGRLTARGWAPPATLVALALVVPWMIHAVRERTPHRSPGGRWGRTARALGVATAAVALVGAQLAAVGATDYRGNADAILVLGAKVHADGTPSGALLDRTRTACELWRAGLASTLVFSGGRDTDAGASEPEAMARIAREAGVPDSALVLDETGNDTASSIAFTARLARERAWQSVLVVSHDYHLARLRLLAVRAGLAVRTVPAVETCPRGWKALAIPREIAAYAATWALLD